MIFKILIVDPIDEEAIRFLQKKYHVLINLRPSREDFLNNIADADVLIMRSGVTVDAEVLRAAKSLKVIARAGIGLDNIDVKVANKKGIFVFRVPSQSSQSVAELCMGLIFSLMRKIPLANTQVKSNIWKKSEMQGVELSGKTIGIIGLGDIGLKIARSSKLLGMNVIACVDHYSSLRKFLMRLKKIALVDLDVVIKKSHIIVVATPLNSNTRHMIDKHKFELMKESPFVVNIARSEIINEDDLIAAIESNQIAGFATDVPHGEGCESKLAAYENVILTPHIGAMTCEAQKRIGDKVIHGIVNNL
ncbi:MAG: NAD(P)-dependent oxidoreductase [Cellvibrionaceae bacterium]